MSGNKMNGYEDRALRKLFAESGLRALKAICKMGMSAKVALINIIQSATGIETYERLTEIEEQLYYNPKVRIRLREAGFAVAVLNEREYREAF